MFQKIISFLLSIIVCVLNFLGIPTCKNVVNKFEEVSYGTHERHTLNLYVPGRKETVGLVLMIHGGAWLGGDKSEYNSKLEELSENGYAAAAINYRYISDDVDLLDIMDDIQLATEKIKALGEECGTDINKMLLTGSSAGGHLSLLYAYSRDEVSAIKPAAVVSYCGPTDLREDAYYFDNGIGDENYVSQIFSWACGYKHTFDTRFLAKDALWEVSPLKYVDENTVPTVINHGMIDNIVPFSNAEALRDALIKFGIEHEFNAYPNSGHGLYEDAENVAIADRLFYKYIETYLN